MWPITLHVWRLTHAERNLLWSVCPEKETDTEHINGFVQKHIKMNSDFKALSKRQRIDGTIFRATKTEELYNTVQLLNN